MDDLEKIFHTLALLGACSAFAYVVFRGETYRTRLEYMQKDIERIEMEIDLMSRPAGGYDE